MFHKEWQAKKLTGISADYYIEVKGQKALLALPRPDLPYTLMCTPDIAARQCRTLAVVSGSMFLNKMAKN